MLSDFLDRSLEFPPEYREGLSSHLPMALHALTELGAPAARLEAFFAHYVRRFADHRGGFDEFASHRADAARRIAADGRDQALRALLPDLWPGVAAAAFHGLIRTAHAVQAGHDAELAAGLAYWRWRFQPVPAPLAPSERIPAARWLEALEAAAAGWSSEAGLISERIAEVAQTDAYRRWGGALAADDDTLATLHRGAAAIYAASRNFTVLHLVTATRALRVLRPWVAETETWLATVAPAFAAGLLASGLRDRSPAPTSSASWSEVTERAVAQDDDHVIKLVHACLESSRLDPDPVFLQAARRALT
jgi:hypothetical protein